MRKKAIWLVFHIDSGTRHLLFSFTARQQRFKRQIGGWIRIQRIEEVYLEGSSEKVAGNPAAPA